MIQVSDLIEKKEELLEDMFWILQNTGIVDYESDMFDNLSDVEAVDFSRGSDGDQEVIEDLIEQVKELESVLNELKNYDSEDKALIPESDWLDYATDWFDDVYHEASQIAGVNEYLQIDYELFADNLKVDSYQVEYEGENYWLSV